MNKYFQQHLNDPGCWADVDWSQSNCTDISDTSIFKSVWKQCFVVNVCTSGHIQDILQLWIPSDQTWPLTRREIRLMWLFETMYSFVRVFSIYAWELLSLEIPPLQDCCRKKNALTPWLKDQSSRRFVFTRRVKLVMICLPKFICSA